MGEPISAAMVAWSRVVAEPRWSPDGTRLAWVESGGGRSDVVVAAADGSGPRVIATGDRGVTGVGAYGGGGFAWAGSARLVVAAADGRLVTVPANGGPATVLTADGRAVAPAPSPDGRQVAFVLDEDDRCVVAVADLTGTGSGPAVLSGADYAWDPAWSPDGRRVAWHEWDLPNMPWDDSRIVGSAPDGADRRVMAGTAGESVGQPRWRPDGTLAYVTDRDGFWNVWAGAGADARPVLPEPREQAEPAWGPGQRSFAFSPDGQRMALNRNEDGFGRLTVVGAAGARDVARGWHHGLDWGAGGLVAVRSGARTPSVVAVTDPDGGARRAVARGPVGGFEAGGLVEPEPVTWPADDGLTVHGLHWQPERSAAGPGTRPPLLVDVHGGPTGQATAGWKPWVQYFVGRGWAVLAPNPRGSTGYGRAYAQALAGEWGHLDVADVAAGIRAAGDRGWCDPDRVVVSGGSAGAMAVLLLCAHHPELVRAGVSMYGVTDLVSLAETTHRFESRYTDRLVGVLPDAAHRYRERSPVTHAASIRVPLLVLQGDADRVVPPDQAQRLVDAVRRGGGAVDAHVYPGEGHGWSRAETVIDVYERVDAFLRRTVLGR